MVMIRPLAKQRLRMFVLVDTLLQVLVISKVFQIGFILFQDLSFAKLNLVYMYLDLIL